MMGRQEAHLQIRYARAVGYLDEMYLPFVVFDMKLECTCALDVSPSVYLFHFYVVLFTVEL
jgi:hypothetical protein